MEKTVFTFLMLSVSIMTFSQIKGKKSVEAFTAPNGAVYNVGDVIQLKEGSNNGTFAFVYESKSSLSLNSITKAANSVKDVKNLNVSSVKNVAHNLDNIQKLKDNELITGTMGSLMNAAVSEKYVTENALGQAYANTKWEIQNFKIYTDKDTGDQIVHAIAKGNGKTVAILIAFAILANEI